MTDLSKCTLAELEAEIERRKAEPDYAAWEPKFQAFREVMDCTLAFTKNHYIRALIAAHNTPLAGEDDGWTEWLKGMAVPSNVSLETHDIQFWLGVDGISWAECWDLSWTHSCYRYRPKQTDGWIPWTGGECPVPGDTVVDVELRNGERFFDRESGYWDWRHSDLALDIIAYRVVKEP